MSTSDSDSTFSGSQSATESSQLPAATLPPLSATRRDGIPPRYASRNGSGSSPRSVNPGAFSMPQDRSGHLHSSNPVTSAMTPEARRQSMIAMDRKRRLTGSGSYEQTRRRYTPTEFLSRTSSEEANTNTILARPMLPPSRSTGSRDVPHEVVDLTASSSPAPPPHSPSHHNQPSRTSSSSSRRYMVPPWQPDSEVTHCPICKKQFTWMFRRHHCRKCGRVVCDSCSPHRITIPRQFIVNPPGLDMGSASPQDEIETIDLTTEGGGRENEVRSRRRSRHASLPTLDGGEKVRLCNPCVPDPQPEPPPNFLPFLEHGGLGATSARPSLSSFPNQPASSAHTNILGQARRMHNVSPLLRIDQAFRYSSLQPASSHSSRDTSAPGRTDYATSLGPRSRPSSGANPYSMYFVDSQQGFGGGSSRGGGLFGGQYSPNASHIIGAQRPLFGMVPQNPPAQLPSMGSFSSTSHGHGRFSSLDIQNRSPPSVYGRPRGSSMFASDPRLGLSPSLSQSRPAVLDPSRPRLHERDICAVCRRALPPRGENGDESARESHVMACISARDPSAVPGGQAGSSSGGRVHMVAFTASEKDCLGEEGNLQECSICMVEYDVGDELARLECFCKFHKECIVSWLNRKAECPVHKASRFNV